MFYQWEDCRNAGDMKPGYEDRSIQERIADRGVPPSDVFVLPSVESWRKRVWILIRDIVTDAVKEELTRNPPEYFVSDDLSWLNDVVLTVTGRDVEMKSLLAARLAREYRAFRAAHGTRTDDLAAFYEHGLRCLRADEAEARARSLFVTAASAGATEERFLAAVAELDARDPAGGREGRIYFCADERSLITRRGGSGHYLVYGSEYTYCLGIRVVGTSKAQDILKSIGRPTMLVCDIPMTIIRDSTLCEFAGVILEHLCQELIGGQRDALGPDAGTAFSLTRDLPAAYVIGHYHPTRIFDPLW